MGFNTEAIRWLEVYLDTRLQFRTHKNLIVEKARIAEDRIRRLTVTRELVLELVPQIQVVAVQTVVLYEAKIW